MNEMFWFSILIFLFSFFLSWFFLIKITPRLIKIVKSNKFIGKDMNKPSKPLVAELGGIPVFIGFILSILITLLFYFIFSFANFGIINIIELFTIFLTMFLIFFMGIIDDILGWKAGISQWQHLLYPILFAIPMIIYTFIYGFNAMHVPLLGVWGIGVIYSWIFVPMAITATTNAFNLLAGYNGLETGLGIIIFSTTAFFALLTGKITLLIILAAWIGALVGFLRFNKYPAKIFPGDIITLVNGALAGICAIILRLEIIVAFLIILYIIEFIIKARHRFATECFGIPQKNGIIKPNPKGGSLIHIVLRRGRFTEKSLVNTFYKIQIIIAIISIAFFFLIYF